MHLFILAHFSGLTTNTCSMIKSIQDVVVVGGKKIHIEGQHQNTDKIMIVKVVSWPSI